MKGFSMMEIKYVLIILYKLLSRNCFRKSSKGNNSKNNRGKIYFIKLLRAIMVINLLIKFKISVEKYSSYWADTVSVNLQMAITPKITGENFGYGTFPIFMVKKDDKVSQIKSNFLICITYYVDLTYKSDSRTSMVTYYWRCFTQHLVSNCPTLKNCNIGKAQSNPCLSTCFL